jgi:hypothetical protein
MGLDIYLYKYENFEETTRKEKLHSEFDENLYAGLEYSKLSEEQKEELREKSKVHAESLGLDQWGSDKMGKERIERSHEKYSDHYFQVGYFRSSYNDSGIERILRNMGLPTLEDVFQNEDEQYHFKPNWEESLKRINSLIEDFSKKGAYRVHSVSDNMFRESTIGSEKDALSVFLEEIEKSKEGGPRSYSNLNGEFYLDEPLKVIGMIPGFQHNIGTRKCIYVITESDNIWYTQALEIVRDTIQFVLDQKDKEKYYLHWSG